jgi:hypothetical protein
MVTNFFLDFQSKSMRVVSEGKLAAWRNVREETIVKLKCGFMRQSVDLALTFAGT